MAELITARPKDVALRIQEERKPCVVLLGAGCSVSASMPCYPQT